MDSTQLRLGAPFVAFVGAGASAIEPSHLPTWSAFNRLVLDALCRRLDQFSRDRQPTAQMLQTMLARRDTTRFLTPDFQAQLIEEEVGADYFAVWQSLPATAFSPVHAALAVLARQRRLAAVVTTNFDTLAEVALQALGVPFSVHHDEASFAALAAGPDEGDVLPVVKIHGSVDDPGSLVDTLRQRLAGRPPALQSLLDEWLRRHRWLFLGYSGADFTHAPNHLNLLVLAGQAAGFVFVQRPGVAVEPGVLALLQAYGPAKAQAVEAELGGFLPAAFGIDAALLPQPAAAPSSSDEVLAAARRGVQGWVDRLGPMAVVNIIVALLRSWGDDASALWLLRKTWKSYRTPGDTRLAAYHRYRHNFGVALRDAGLLYNDIERASAFAGTPDSAGREGLSAFEHLSLALEQTRDPATAAALAVARAYRGDVGGALDLLSRAVGVADAQGDARAICDVAIEAAAVADVAQIFGATIELLHEACQHAMALGDSLRRGWLAALLGRFLGYAGRTDEAERWLGEADAVAAQFDQQALQRCAAAARGLVLLESGRARDSAVLLARLATELHAADAVALFSHVDMARADPAPTEVKGTSALRVRVLLDLNRAAMCLGDVALMSATLDDLDIITVDPYRGWYPHYCAAHIECLDARGSDGARETILERLSTLEALAQEQQNPWAAQTASIFRQQLFPEGGALA